MLGPWKESYDKPEQHIKKQRHHFTNKGLYNQSYGFSSSHIWIWELDPKEGWAWRTDVFKWVSSSPSGGQSIGASGSASVLPMNIQGWFPLGLTGLIFLQSKGLSRVLSSTTVQKHQFFWCSKAFSLLDGPTLTSIHDYWKNHSFDYMVLCW